MGSGAGRGKRKRGGKGKNKAKDPAQQATAAGASQAGASITQSESLSGTYPAVPSSIKSVTVPSAEPASQDGGGSKTAQASAPVPTAAAVLPTVPQQESSQSSAAPKVAAVGPPSLPDDTKLSVGVSIPSKRDERLRSTTELGIADIEVASHPSMPSGSSESGSDSEDSRGEGKRSYKPGGYCPVAVGDVFVHKGKRMKYAVRRKLGWGHFSTVWLCDEIPVDDTGGDGSSSKVAAAAATAGGTERERPPYRQVALKVQKSSARYTEAAADEARLLRAVARRAGLWAAVREEEEAVACARRERKRRRRERRAARVRARLDRGLPIEVAAAVHGEVKDQGGYPKAASRDDSLPPHASVEYVRRWTSMGRPAPPMPGPTPAPVTRLLSGFTAKSKHGRHACLAMGVLDGGNLLDVVREHDHRGLPPLIARRLIRRAAESLDLLTRGAGLIHTDVKLENLILAPCKHVPWRQSSPTQSDPRSAGSAADGKAPEAASGPGADEPEDHEASWRHYVMRGRAGDAAGAASSGGGAEAAPARSRAIRSAVAALMAAEPVSITTGEVLQDRALESKDEGEQKASAEVKGSQLVEAKDGEEGEGEGSASKDSQAGSGSAAKGQSGSGQTSKEWRVAAAPPPGEGPWEGWSAYAASVGEDGDDSAVLDKAALLPKPFEGASLADRMIAASMDGPIRFISSALPLVEQLCAPVDPADQLAAAPASPAAGPASAARRGQPSMEEVEESRATYDSDHEEESSALEAAAHGFLELKGRQVQRSIVLRSMASKGDAMPRTLAARLPGRGHWWEQSACSADDEDGDAAEELPSKSSASSAAASPASAASSSTPGGGSYVPAALEWACSFDAVIPAHGAGVSVAVPPRLWLFRSAEAWEGLALAGGTGAGAGGAGPRGGGKRRRGRKRGGGSAVGSWLLAIAVEFEATGSEELDEDPAVVAPDPLWAMKSSTSKPLKSSEPPASASMSDPSVDDTSSKDTRRGIMWRVRVSKVMAIKLALDAAQMSRVTQWMDGLPAVSTDAAPGSNPGAKQAQTDALQREALAAGISAVEAAAPTLVVAPAQPAKGTDIVRPGAAGSGMAAPAYADQAAVCFYSMHWPALRFGHTIAGADLTCLRSPELLAATPKGTQPSSDDSSTSGSSLVAAHVASLGRPSCMLRLQKASARVDRAMALRSSGGDGHGTNTIDSVAVRIEALIGSQSDGLAALEGRLESAAAPERGIEAAMLPDEPPRTRWTEMLQLDCRAVDLGNACWEQRHYSSDVQTRQYRAPEVLLGAPYQAQIDVWSWAAVGFELLTGDLMFDPKGTEGSENGSEDDSEAEAQGWTRNEDHLCQMVEIMGPLPMSLIRQAKRRYRHTLLTQDEFGRPLLSRVDEVGDGQAAVSESKVDPSGRWLQHEQAATDEVPPRSGRTAFLDDTSSSAHYVAFNSIDKVRLWPVASVLHEKYAVFLPEARLVAAALRPGMVLDPTRRAPAAALLASPWLGGGGARGAWHEAEACPHWGAAMDAQHRSWGKAVDPDASLPFQDDAIRQLGSPSSYPPPQGWPRLWSAAELAWRRPQRYGWLVDGAVLCLPPVQRLVLAKVTDVQPEQAGGTAGDKISDRYTVSVRLQCVRPRFVRALRASRTGGCPDDHESNPLFRVHASPDNVSSDQPRPGQKVGFVSGSGWSPEPEWGQKAETVWIPIEEVRACAQCGQAEDTLHQWEQYFKHVDEMQQEHDNAEPEDREDATSRLMEAMQACPPPVEWWESVGSDEVLATLTMQLPAGPASSADSGGYDDCAVGKLQVPAADMKLHTKLMWEQHEIDDISWAPPLPLEMLRAWGLPGGTLSPGGWHTARPGLEPTAGLLSIAVEASEGSKTGDVTAAGAPDVLDGAPVPLLARAQASLSEALQAALAGCSSSGDLARNELAAAMARLTRPRLDRWCWVYAYGPKEQKNGDDGEAAMPTWGELALATTRELWGCVDERDECVLLHGGRAGEASAAPTDLAEAAAAGGAEAAEGSEARAAGDAAHPHEIAVSPRGRPIPRPLRTSSFGPFSATFYEDFSQLVLHKGQLELRSATIISLPPPDDGMADPTEYELIASACVFDDSRETSASACRRLTLGRGPALVPAQQDRYGSPRTQGHEPEPEHGHELQDLSGSELGDLHNDLVDAGSPRGVFSLGLRDDHDHEDHSDGEEHEDDGVHGLRQAADSAAAGARELMDAIARHGGSAFEHAWDGVRTGSGKAAEAAALTLQEAMRRARLLDVHGHQGGEGVGPDGEEQDPLDGGSLDVEEQAILRALSREAEEAGVDGSGPGSGRVMGALDGHDAQDEHEGDARDDGVGDGDGDEEAGVPLHQRAADAAGGALSGLRMLGLGLMNQLGLGGADDGEDDAGEGGSYARHGGDGDDSPVGGLGDEDDEDEEGDVHTPSPADLDAFIRRLADLHVGSDAGGEAAYARAEAQARQHAETSRPAGAGAGDGDDAPRAAGEGGAYAVQQGGFSRAAAGMGFGGGIHVSPLHAVRPPVPGPGPAPALAAGASGGRTSTARGSATGPPPSGGYGRGGGLPLSPLEVQQGSLRFGVAQGVGGQAGAQAVDRSRAVAGGAGAGTAVGRAGSASGSSGGGQGRRLRPEVSPMRLVGHEKGRSDSETGGDGADVGRVLEDLD